MSIKYKESCLLAFITHCLFLHFRQQKSMNKLSHDLLRLHVSASAKSHDTFTNLKGLFQ